jgi:predicted RNase H-like HicB family nuclease
MRQFEHAIHVRSDLACLPTMRYDHHGWEEEYMKIEVDREEDGRWIAEVTDLPGVMAYGKTREQAVAKAESLALRAIADRLDHGEAIPELRELFSVSI